MTVKEINVLWEDGEKYMKSEKEREFEYITDLSYEFLNLQNYVTENVDVARLVENRLIDIKAELKFLKF